MKQLILGFALLVGGATLASAEDVRIEKKVEQRPGVRVEVPVPGVGVERRERVETTGRATGCDTKTVTQEEPGETKTVTKKRC